VERHPELANLLKNEEARQRLCEAVVEGWEDLDEAVLNGLIKIMRKRLEVVITADGWHQNIDLGIQKVQSIWIRILFL
jgi:CO dehydrogenase/acetyl-CoA synthase epsilon subunit